MLHGGSSQPLGAELSESGKGVMLTLHDRKQPLVPKAKGVAVGTGQNGGSIYVALSSKF